MDLAQFWNNTAGAYEIDQSLRFDGSGSKLVLASPSSSYTTNKFTMSCWVKLGPIASPFTMMNRDGAPNNVTNTWCILNAFGNNTIISYMYTASINGRGVLNTAGVQRDASAWYHVVFGYDSSSGNTQRIWVNGVEQTTGKDTISGVAGFEWSSTYPFVIGGGSSHAYCAEYHFIDGTWLDSPSDFGKPDPTTGAWIPKRYTGSYGTNGFYLKFDPTATNGIGHDHSGNGNHFTATGFDTTNTTAATYDVMSDTPTNNYATLNALAKGSTLTMSDGNLAIYGGHGTTTSTIAVTSGMKAYMEYQISSSFVNGSSACGFGVAQKTDPYSSFPGNASDLWWVYQSNQWSIYPSDGGGGAYDYPTGKSLSGNTVQIAIDYDAGKVWIGINNTWYTSSNASNGNPSAGTGEMFSTTFTKPVHFLLHIAANVTNYANFGQRAFAYTPPTGFKALNTSNLPEPTIKDGGKYFATTLWNGNSATRTITVNGIDNVGFAWLKARSTADNHTLANVVVGGDKYLKSNSTDAELSSSSVISAISSNTFTVGSDAQTNRTGDTYVGWTWAAGGTGSTNTAGTITSTVSANPTAGFSIVSYTASGSSGATVGHGLGVAPSFIIVKNRDYAQNWFAYHQYIGGAGGFNFNTSQAAFTSDAGYWNNTNPSSSLITLGNYHGTFGTHKYIAYCFSEVAGYSKFGSYTGNGSTDGPFVYCGFSVQWLLYKRSSAAENWVILDNSRDTYNVADAALRPDLSNVEFSNTEVLVDFTSNGFKLRSSDVKTNGSGSTYIFAAFAEHPFKYANAR